MNNKQRPFFTLHRTDIPRRRKDDKAGLGLLVSLFGLLGIMVGTIGYALWSAL